MSRALLAWSSCALALWCGVFSAALATENRARGDELDRLERWCEAQARKNELARVANQCQEGQLLHGPCFASTSAAASAAHGSQVVELTP